MKQLVGLLLMCLSFVCQAQEKPSPIFVSDDAPHWMKMMVEENPNVFEIQKAYDAYFQENPFEKTSYTQYFKRWMHWARPLVQEDGNVHEPTVKEMEQLESIARSVRKKSQIGNSNRSNAGWTFLGPKQTFDTDGIQEVTWQTNVYSLDISLSDPNVLYAGGESGGAWKTTDKGMHWELLTKDVAHGAFTAIKIHPTDPNTAYAATSGKIIKTTDGGANWTTVYSANSFNVHDIAFKIDQPEIVLAASNQGLLRTVDGGANWTKLHSQETWAVEFKPGDPLTVFAIRKSGSSSDFRISNDGGATFVNASSGWWVPGAGESVTGAHIAVCPSNPAKVYAYLCGSGGNLGGYIGVFKSSNSGASWSNTNPSNLIGQPYSIPNHTNLMDANGVDWFNQGFYDMGIVVNPSNENELIAGGCSWFKSTNGGQTWESLGAYVGGLSWSHPDMQALVANGSDLWIASDGGLNYSNNFGQSIEARMNGISGSDMWGFDSGWNEDVLVGGRYHNGNMAWHESFPEGKFYRLGGAESATGYVNPGDARKTHHSDIGGYRLKGGFPDGVSYFPIGMWPNESYAYYANSEMVWDPRCWNIVYIGHENKIWKSMDGGTSYSALHSFPGNADNKVYDIEVSRSNPDVIYCSQWDGTDDAMWRTSDGGQSWTQLTKLPLPNNNDRVKMAVSAEDENVLWVAVTYGSNGKKIYKTIDGGSSWINLTTSTLDNIRIANIMAQYGTDGGIYLGTNVGVFYRNNGHDDWQPYSLGFPISAETNRLKPFYKNNKIRNGCWGFGVWEADLFEPSSIIAQPMASTLEANCSRDTVYFDDHSVLNHNGASWSWEFSPAPMWMSATDVRNPKVVFGLPGTYTATLTVNGSYSNSMTIKVNEGCRVDTVPGSTVTLQGNDFGDYVAIPSFGLSTNTITITAWIKPDGVQPDYSCIFMHDGNSAGFNFLPGSNHLGYHWPGGAWWWDSGLTVPDGVWSHVAMVVEPSGITLYLNGRPSKHSFATQVVDFDSGGRLGNYKGWGGRYMKGTIDEVSVFNKSLTQAEIRELMHLTKDPSERPDLLVYYQFNEASGLVLDKVGVRHGSLVGPTIKRERSTAPVGKGISQRMQVLSGKKRFNFEETGLVLEFPPAGTYPNGEVVVTRLSVSPDTLPVSENNDLSDYWILENYGTNPSFTVPTNIWFEKLGDMPADIPASACKLWSRGPIDHGPLWQNIDLADEFKEGKNAYLAFTSNNQLKTSGQYWLELPGLLETRYEERSTQHLTKQPDFRVFPNPIAASGTLQLISDLGQTITFRLFDEKGQQIRMVRFTENARLPLLGPAGNYAYRMESENHIKTGNLIIN